MLDGLASAAAPSVSVIVANFNGARFLPAFLRLALRQSLQDFEIIVTDDASTDESAAIIRNAARSDPRIILQSLSKNSGPAAARNAGLKCARGKWIAIVDADDLMHPDRLRHLVARAEKLGADIVADNLLVFHDNGEAPSLFLKAHRVSKPAPVSLAEYLRENLLLSSRPALGFLKPLFRRDFLERFDLRYNEQIRIGEDYDIVARALAKGAKFWIDPAPYYLYRKHSHSISHRLTNCDIDGMTAGDDAICQSLSSMPREVESALKVRTASLRRAKAWNDLVAQIKARDIGGVVRSCAAHPNILPLLLLPISSRVRKFARQVFPRAPNSQDGAKGAICLISRQRLANARSGSSNYVLSLAAFLRDAGYGIHLIQPTPLVFGRIPFLAFEREGAVFNTIKIRGAVKFGRMFVSLDPARLLATARGVAVRILAKAGISLRDKPAPYAIGAEWAPEDFLFVARHAPCNTKAIIADYAFQTAAIPYVLNAEAKSLVVMHDLFSSRGDQFTRLGTSDSVSALSEAEEIGMLRAADFAIAIQQDEADFVSARLPRNSVICAPLAVTPVAAAQPGNDDTLLFVGSNTAPNTIGLNWFFEQVWEHILAARPDAHLKVAGSVNRSISARPKNVEFLGIVPDLTPLYSEAGVVISPLTAGSGLKIKLVEALAHGKAMVVTPPTVQGVAAIVEGAVKVTGDPAYFAGAVIRLLSDRDVRAKYAEAALDVAIRNFSATACYGAVLAALENDATQRPPEHDAVAAPRELSL